MVYRFQNASEPVNGHGQRGPTGNAGNVIRRKRGVNSVGTTALTRGSGFAK
jgi:hypothetical protein